MSLSQRETQQPLNKCEQLEPSNGILNKESIQKTTKESEEKKNGKLQKNENGERKGKIRQKAQSHLNYLLVIILSSSTVNVPFQLID